MSGWPSSQRLSPSLRPDAPEGWPGWISFRGGDHTPQFRLELRGDPVLTPLGMIGRDSMDQPDVAPSDPGSAGQKDGTGVGSLIPAVGQFQSRVT